MTGGLIQLVAYGYDDIYLTHDPQITFFKVIYRRHTNFSTEQVQSTFTHPPNFGEKFTCPIPRVADLMGKTFIVVTIPKIKIVDKRLQFAWIKRVGFGIIKSIEIEINGRVIDKHYGEWLNLWSELTGEINGNHERGFKKMIGDLPELYDFSTEKDDFKLFIPLNFWFCRNIGLSLPLVSLQYSDIKINVEFEDADKCYIFGPTHYIKCRDDIVNFEPFEYIEQNIDGEIRAGIFIDFDISTKRLYYCKITPDKLTSIPVDSSFDSSDTNLTVINSLLESPSGLKYAIVGKTSEFSTFAEFNNFSISYPSQKIRNLNIVECFLLIDYHFLDSDERTKFAQAKHDYLIEQLFVTPEISMDSANFGARMIGEQPCKLMVWVAQLKYIKDSNDKFNYTDSYVYTKTKTKYKTKGDSLISTEELQMNSNPVVSSRSFSYFN